MLISIEVESDDEERSKDDGSAAGRAGVDGTPNMYAPVGWRCRCCADLSTPKPL